MTPRQSRFVDEYLLDPNAARAYSAAFPGVSLPAAKSGAARLLRNVKVAAAIAAAQAERAARVDVTTDAVLRDVQAVVERCMQRAPVMMRRGREMVQVTDDEGRHVWQFDARGAIAGLTLLAKHLGMLTDRHEISGPNGGAIPHAITVRFVKPAI